ncbi:ATP-binding protein [Promicromonospora sp. NPDC057138]|uniref:ATP-binding protein n=1 Tax=Promicromonospora sp. NPDC057138 TaxID=3346031 RepID=UPI0036310AB0
MRPLGARPAERLAVEPDWPTTIRARFGDGLLQGTDGSVWLYRSVPLAPVAEARTAAEGLETAEPLLAVLDELAAATPVRWARRAQSRHTYRNVHALLVNLPERWSPPRDHPQADYLARQFPDTATYRRVVLFGVQLRASVGGGGGLRRAIDSVAETLVAGGTPLSDFEQDHREMAALSARCGLRTPSDDEVALASAWWNEGGTPDVPLLSEPDCLHVFTGPAAARQAKAAGTGADLSHIGGQHTITFAAVSDLALPYIAASDSRGQWVSELVTHGALVVSIRGKVEPAAVTRAELRRQRRRYLEDITESAGAGKMERAEQIEQEQILTDVEGAYALPGPPPTLVETTAVVGFNGYVADMNEISRWTTATLLPMHYRQRAALAETMLCSPVRANPHLQDLPAQTVAASGLPALSTVGDSAGALVGFTEHDRQPAWLDPMAATDGDSLPIAVAVAQTGGGKSLFMAWLANQLARQRTALGERTPVVVVDPKTDSDLSASFPDAQIASLDELVRSDGVFDPIRFAANPAVGVELAASMLMTVNPWGPRVEEYEATLQYALHHGVTHGARCTGEALRIAEADGEAPSEMVEAVFRVAKASPMFRSMFGVEPTTEGLRVAEGITLIKVGEAHLDLPAPGATIVPLPQRIAAAVVRMMVFGSAMALSGRDGVLMLDEAWVFMSAGRAEMERLGRVARQQRVFPALFTQRVTDALNAGLRGYISRGFIGPIEDPDEAQAACQLFKLEPTPERLERITSSATIGSGVSEAPNWNSMRALVDRGTRRVRRGSVWIYSDLANRAVPTEVLIPDEFLRRTSTNAAEMRARAA